MTASVRFHASVDLRNVQCAAFHFELATGDQGSWVKAIVFLFASRGEREWTAWISKS